MENKLLPLARIGFAEVTSEAHAAGTMTKYTDLSPREFLARAAGRSGAAPRGAIAISATGAADRSLGIGSVSISPQSEDGFLVGSIAFASQNPICRTSHLFIARQAPGLAAQSRCLVWPVF